jgi:GntR family transcriptional regulator, transcriptional repressor for pyruvate dehydrogenase complex
MDRAETLVPQTAVRQIQEMINTGELRQGERLPPQRALSERLDVSRASLREALSVLETLGLLRTVPRQGTFVADAEMAGSLGAHRWRYAARSSPAEVYQFRFVTEGYAARLAAMRVSEPELVLLRQNLKSFKEAVRVFDLLSVSDLDFAFHRSIATFSGNRLFEDLYYRRGAVVRESQLLPMARQERLWEPVAEHENVLQAMEQRDPDGASYFMHVHIMRAAARIGVALNDIA